jgi:hypothetical protein
MRLLWVIVLLALAAGLYLYFNPDHGGKLSGRLPRPDLIHRTDRLYQWRDVQGNWQFTDTPPPAGIDYEQRDYRDDVNVLPPPPGVAGQP